MNKDDLIGEIKDLELLGMIDRLNQVYDNGRKARLSKYFSKYEADKINEVADFAHEILFLLQSGMRPAALSESDFQKTKILTENLVKKKNLIPSALSIYI